MNTRLPKETAIALFETLNSRDVTALASLFAEDSVFHFPGQKTLLGRERIEKFFITLFFKFPRLVFSVVRIISDAKCAALEWTNEGETRAGKPYRNAGVTVVGIDDDHIVYLSDTFKDTSFLG
jgi:uncharacterized protein (TIGR02246 family)